MKPNRGVGESYGLFAAKYGMNVSPSELSQRFRVCFAEAPRLAFPGASDERVAVLERDWWKLLVAKVFEPWGRFDAFDDFFTELFAYFAQPEAWRLYPEVLDTLARLKERGLHASVISNFDSRLINIIQGLGIGSFFDHIFVSSRIGYAKPEAGIFHYALRVHNVDPGESLHVGDSEVNDRDGAASAGVRGILVDRSRASTTDDSDHIASLKSILDLVQ